MAVRFARSAPSDFQSCFDIQSMLIQTLNPQRGTQQSGSENSFATWALPDCIHAENCSITSIEGTGFWIVLFWVLGSLVVGLIARTQDHSAGAWTILSLICSPLIGGMFLLSRGKGRTTCPYCHDLMDVDEVFCRTCGNRRPPDTIYE